MSKQQIAIDAVEALHRTTFYNKYGREVFANEGFGGWCMECGRVAAGAPSCPTIQAIRTALDGQS